MTRLAAAALAAVAASCAAGDRGRPAIEQVPRAEVARALAAESIPVPPRLVVLGSGGEVRVADAPRGVATLTALGGKVLPAGVRTTLDDLRAERPEQEGGDPFLAGVGPARPRPASAGPPELPSRLGEVIGTIHDDAGRGAPVLVLAAPAARATTLVEVLAASGGIVAVAHRGTLRALRIEFGRYALERDAGRTWLEIRVTRTGLEVENVPEVPESVPWASGTVDRVGLERALAAARTRRELGRRADVDVLVAPEISAQRLVDVLVQLEALGVRAIVLGRMPPRGSDEATLRGRRIIAVVVGQPQSVGDLDKAVIRRIVKERVPQIRACYEDALARDDTLTGVVNTQFFIAPNGNVSASNANGVSPEVAACVARVIKSIVFPKPGGGGGVQVNYPFLLRS